MTTEMVPYDAPAGLEGISAKAPALFLKEARASERFFDFFTANIRNKHTRRAYYNAACKFSEFCAERGVHDLAHVKPVHVGGYVESLLPGFAKPTVKQHLAAIQMVFDWLVVGHIGRCESCPCGALPQTCREKGSHACARPGRGPRLLSSIDMSTLVGLRDRAFIATTICRRGWVRLHEKGRKEHDAPCISKLEAYLDEYIAAAGIADGKDGPLFRTTGRFTGVSHRMTQRDGYRMIERRARKTGIKTRIGNHSMRATGITDYLKSEDTLEHAQNMAAHSFPRTTKLYDRRNDDTALDECEKVRI